MDQDEISSSSDLSLGSLLAKLPGLDSSGYGPSVGQPIIRGLGGFRIGVLNNGMSTGDIAYTGDDHSNGVPIHNLERIEVLKDLLLFVMVLTHRQVWLIVSTNL